MIDGFSDPYEQADQRFEEAKLVTPQPAKKSRKIVIVGLVLAGVIVAVVILSGIAGMLANKSAANAPVGTEAGDDDQTAERELRSTAIRPGQVHGRHGRRSADATKQGHGSRPR